MVSHEDHEAALKVLAYRKDPSKAEANSTSALIKNLRRQVEEMQETLLLEATASATALTTTIVLPALLTLNAIF